MEPSLLCTVGYRVAGGHCHSVGTALLQAIALVKQLKSKSSCGLVVAVGSVAFLIGEPAAADPYKWCAVYRVGGTNCGFTTIEQCRATVSGVGGSCEPNQFYTGPDKTSAQRPAKQAQRKPPVDRRAQEHRAQERRTTATPASERRGPEDRFQ